jgi:glycosyltransferase involved in cell wall biosynthesis
MDNHKIIAVIPAYNEAATIAAVISGITPIVQGVVVVNDCSKDDTSANARTAGASVVDHAQNSGYDGSIDDGFKEAARLGADIIVTCDADGQHRAEDLRAVCEPVIRGEADVVIGERSRLTRFGETIFSLYTQLRFGIRDPLCGLKAYRREVYDTIGYFDTLKSIGTQLMVEAWLKGFRLKKVPITVMPRPDESRFYAKLFRANMKILGAAWRIVKLSILRRRESRSV